MKTLVRNKAHQAPMLAILKRAKIGKADQYGRGYWIADEDMPAIEEYFRTRGHAHGSDFWLNGTNQHNQVMLSEFKKLFEGGTTK